MKAAIVPCRKTGGDGDFHLLVIGSDDNNFPPTATGLVANVDPQSGIVTLRLAEEGEDAFGPTPSEDA